VTNAPIQLVGQKSNDTVFSEQVEQSSSQTLSDRGMEAQFAGLGQDIDLSFLNADSNGDVHTKPLSPVHFNSSSTPSSNSEFRAYSSAYPK
jgi:hypothetical protein